MKDASKITLQASRPSITALDGVNFCLGQLYKDKTKNITDEIVHHLTFEELIGTLLIVRDELEAIASEDDYEDDYKDD